MASKYKLIPDIKPGETGWTVKAIVSEKCPPNKARNSQLKYQHIWLMDPKGNKVHVTLFDNAIQHFKTPCCLQKTYLISNAQVKTTDNDYRTTIGDIRWTINAKTSVVEVNEQFNSLLASTYNFTPFENLQSYMDTPEEISIIGIAIDVHPKRVIQLRDNQSTVQDVILINERLQTRLLRMWDNFVANEGDTISNTLTKRPVVVGKRLRVTSFNGISVSIKVTSAILIDPPFQQVIELRHWLEANINTANDIVTKKTYIFPTSNNICCPPEEKQLNIRQVQHLHMQKNFWIKANVTLISSNQPLCYLSCNNCNISSNAKMNETFFCRYCKYYYAISTPRARATVELQDPRGTITTSIIGNPAEAFYKCSAEELLKYLPREQDDIHPELQTATQHEHILYIKCTNTEGPSRQPPYEVIFIIDPLLKSGEDNADQI